MAEKEPTETAKWEYDLLQKYHIDLSDVEKPQELRKSFGAILGRDLALDLESRCNNDSGEIRLSPLSQGSGLYGMYINLLNTCIERRQIRTALQLALDVYDLLLAYQWCLYKEFVKSGDVTDAFRKSKFHKGHLLWEIVRILGYMEMPWYRRQYVKLTLIEDIISKLCSDEILGKLTEGKQLKDCLGDVQLKAFTDHLKSKTGSFSHLMRELHIPDDGIQALVQEVIDVLSKQFELLSHEAKSGKYSLPLSSALFPESVQLYSNVLSDYPVRCEGRELDCYFISRSFYNWLAAFYYWAKQEGHSTLAGYRFEQLCAYLCSCVPAARVLFNQQGEAGQSDVLLVMDTKTGDFRDECGPHIMVECKSGGDGHYVGNVASLIGKSVLFNSHMLFSVQEPTKAGKSLESVALLSIGKSYMHFDAKVILPKSGRETGCLMSWNCDAVDFTELLETLTNELPAIDFLSLLEERI